ncbi:MAG: L-rhamnose isomerase [Verrucomicrobia bacterium]|nr:L-rhamnose isomerase [Verrucomicrobiota bacterium]
MTPYDSARERFAAWGIDADAALTTLDATPISLHCWQGDDVAGFENASGNAGSGCVATGNHPGKARNFSELTSDLEQVASLLPGPLRINLHASYATDNAAKADRDALTIAHFGSWLDWAKDRGWGVDFNPTCFGHSLAADGFTLSHRDPAVRKFWIDHCIASRRIAAAFGEALNNPVVTNIWIPDGTKDRPADRLGPRERLAESLDAIFASDLGSSAAFNIDAVESKLFGIGVESYTVGSHEFYLGYAASHQVALCLDAGHFHPTESVADKISAVMLHVPRLLLHVSRGVRWDSDHVVMLDDPTREMLHEVVVGGFLPRTHVGLDFFDASINRIAAWTIGTRNTQKAVLLGLLAPQSRLTAAENSGDDARRLSLFEDWRSLPWGAVWDEHCVRHDRLRDGEWMNAVDAYTKTVLSGRSEL